MKARLGIIAAAALIASCNRPAPEPEVEQPSYVPAHSIKQLMAVVVEPQSQVFWGSAGVLIDEHGEHDLTPADDQAWLRTQSAAATVTEMGNLLQTPLYAKGRGKDWIQFSKGLAEIGIKAEKAAVARDSNAIFEVSTTMSNVCSACHQAYPPAAGERPAPAPGGQVKE